jgi:hypothetical protein
MQVKFGSLSKLANSEITFCIQGQISISQQGFNQTEALIESIEHNFPGSPIVFATWKLGSKSDFKFRNRIKVIELEDPGSGLRVFGSSQPNNINRQIRSSRAALEAARTEYAVKIRSDIVFTSNRLRKVLQRLSYTPDSNSSFFVKYVAVSDYLTIHPCGPLAIPMHPCDYIQAGLLVDVRKYWSVDEISFDDENYFASEITNGCSKSNLHLPRHRAESYFWKELVRVHTGQDLDSLLTKEESLELSTIETFANNIIPLNKKSLGVQSQKYNWGLDFATFTYAFTFFDWFKATKNLGLKPRLVPFSIIEIFGVIYRQASRVKGLLKIQLQR